MLNYEPTEDRSDGSIETEQTTDWQTAVLDAIELLETASDGDTPADEAEFKLKAGRDRLAGLDTSIAPDRVAETIDAAVARLEAYDDTPARASTTSWSTLAELAPLAAKAARATPGPFFEELDDLPRIENPKPEERRMAETYFGADSVPDDGAIPDYHPFHHVPIEIEVSELTLDAVRRRHEGEGQLDRGAVLDDVRCFAIADEQYRTPDGRDAVEVILEELSDSNR